MNTMIQQMITQFMGQNGMAMLQKWSSMTPQQQQTELNKVMNLSKEQQTQYLIQNGIDVNALKQQTSKQPNVESKSEFKF